MDAPPAKGSHSYPKPLCELEVCVPPPLSVLQVAPSLSTSRPLHSTQASNGRVEERAEEMEEERLAIKKEMEAMLAVNAPRRKQALLSQAFSLAGINVLPFKGNRLLLVLGSSHEGHYYNKRFYVWLESDTVTKQLRVFKHTLPYFVPIKQLEEQHLVKNVRHFVRALSVYINAFVARRAQAMSLNQQPHMESIETSPAFDYMCFSFKSLDYGSVRVNLKFELERSRPSEVHASFLDPPKRLRNPQTAESERLEWKMHVEESIKSLPLVEAYTQLFATVDTSVNW